MKTKKQYTKPRLTQVQLAIQNPVLANCNSVNTTISGFDVCNVPGAACPDTGVLP
jgi:hypothetical protein